MPGLHPPFQVGIFFLFSLFLLKSHKFFCTIFTGDICNSGVPQKSSILETGRFFAASGVQLAQHDCGLFHFRRAVFSPELKTKVGRTLDKTTPVRES
jgi:hypothetical protein